MDEPTVCVIVPTVATSERGPLLLRALASVRSQAGVLARPVVIVNGPGADGGVIQSLLGMPDVRLLRLPEADLPGALAAGRELVDTEFCAELDDDDELVPGTLAARIARITAPDAPDAVVANTLVAGDGVRTLLVADVDAVAGDPLGSLLAANWLSPGAALFRSATVPVEFFRGIPRYLEWTYLGLVLALSRKVAFLAEPGVVHHLGHPFSVDRSRECLRGRPHAFASLLALDLPAHARRALRAKLGAAWHAAAESWLADGHLSPAWRAHGRSLVAPGGWRYLLYTRRLFRRVGRPAGAVPEVPGA